MKHRTGFFVAAVFAVLSAAALADGKTPLNAARMSDAELDQVSAAGAQTGHVVLNSGNANVFRPHGDPAAPSVVCVNCDLVGGGVEGPAMGAHLIINRGHPLGKVRCFGGFSIPGAC